MGNIISSNMPKDLPENWTENQYVSPGGVEVGLTEKHGYNYLMKQVNLAQKSIEELDTYLSGVGGKNLLHNWFLASAVDTKLGYIVPTGTPYYSNTALTTQAGTTTKYMKANWVNSNYGTITVGTTTYYVRTSAIQRGHVSSGISVDMWYLSSGMTDSFLRILTDSVVLGLSPLAALTQSINYMVNPYHYTGRVFTLSAIVNAVGAGTHYLIASFGDDVEILQPITAAGLTSVTFTVPEGVSEFSVGIVNRHESQTGSITVSAVKLEVGQMSTLEGDPPADYAEQMAVCIQYNSSNGAFKGFPSLLTANVMAEATITE